MKNLLATIFAMFVVVTFAYSQHGSIRGKIYDIEKRRPLEGVRVIAMLKGTVKDSTHTDSAGSFNFKSLNPDTYSIKCIFIGYQPATLASITVRAGMITDQKITYLANVLSGQLNEVEISRDRNAQVKRGEIGIHYSSKEVVHHKAAQTRRIPGKASGVDSRQTYPSYSGSKPAVSSKPVIKQGTTGYRWSFGDEQQGQKGSQQRFKTRTDSMNEGSGSEEYAALIENPFVPTHRNLLSTFSIDVDRAGYSNMRRYLTGKQLPPKDAVRTEELLNYFNYNYPQPTDDKPFSISTEIGDCPWNKEHKLLHVGLQGKIIPLANIPPMNLVFLIDVSGSMMSANKLPLVKESLKMLVTQLRKEDKISMVVYAGAAGLVLAPTSGNNKNKIMEAIDKLSAGGSTAGGAGINRAYAEAQSSFIKEGNNRVILCTDGDFNVGISSEQELQKLIEEKRQTGISLSVLGFGMGNLKDNRMELLADKGNGNYAYIDKSDEAKKVMVHEIGGTLYTIAKDVKIQLEFNPMHVKEYRLIGYENRKLNNEDFENDAIDAGDLGSGHNVTALYEIVPNLEKTAQGVLKYDASDITPSKLEGDEWLYIKLRYKLPSEEKSKLIVKKIGVSETNNVTDNFYFSAAVAEFAMLLHNSKYLGKGSFKEVETLASNYAGSDPFGYKKEFLDLIATAKELSEPKQAQK